MFALEKLSNTQTTNKSLICLGLDLDPKKMPPEYSKSIKQMYEFAMRIVNATKDVVCAYKPNMAFFETHGHEGVSLLESICNRIPENIPIILDGKRGDIGNTASFYADAMFNRMRADWVTLNPYMGYDALRPFLEHKDKGIFVLCLTSNTGSKDFQLLDVGGKPLYKIVAEKVDYWNKEDNCGLVVGATQPEQLKEIRSIVHNMPILIPGVGAQGGSLEKAVLYGTEEFKKVAVINVSRSVLYASNGEDFAEKARAEVERLNALVERLRSGERNIESDQTQQVQDSTQQSQSQEQSDDSKPEEQKQSQASIVINKPNEQQQSQSQPQQDSQSDSKPSEPESPSQKSSIPQQPEEKPATESVPTPPPPPVNEPKPENQSQPNTDKPKEEPPQKEEQPKKEPPPMPKPPPPLPPVPEIPRFDKPKQDNNQQNNQNQNRDRRDFSNNNRNDRKFGNNNNRNNNNRRFNDNDRNRNRNDYNK